MNTQGVIVGGLMAFGGLLLIIFAVNGQLASFVVGVAQ